jgi:Bacterial mobilisation protein (MobC)
MNPLDRPSIADAFRNAVEHNPVYGNRKIPPFSLRLTTEEKALLARQAGSVPLGAYIRSQLLGNAAAKRREARMPVKDQKALGQLLGALGTAKLANNLNQLAKAANTGSLAVTPETEKALQDACRDVAWMRARLVAALGLGGGP